MRQPIACSLRALILPAVCLLLALHLGLVAITPGTPVHADGLDPFIPQSQFNHAAYFEQVPPGNYALDFQVESGQNAIDPRNWFNDVGAAGRNNIGQALTQIMSLFMVAEAYVTRVVLELLGWCYRLPIVPQVTRALTPLFSGIVGQFYYALLDFWLVIRAGHIAYLMLRGRSAASFNKFIILILLVLLDTALIARPADALLSADAVVSQISGAVLTTINGHLPSQWDEQYGRSYIPSQPISDPAEHAIAVTGGAIWDLAVTQTWCAAEVGSGLSGRPCQEATQTLLTQDPGQRAASSTFVQGCVALPDDTSQHFNCLQFGNLGERFLIVLIGALDTLLLVGFLAFLGIVLLALKVGMDVWWLLGAFVIGFNIAPQIGERVTISWLRRMGDLLVGVLVVGTVLAVVLIVARAVLAAAASAGPLGQMLAWTAVMAFVMWQRRLWMPLVFGAASQAIAGSARPGSVVVSMRGELVGSASARHVESGVPAAERGRTLFARHLAGAGSRPEWVARSDGGSVADASMVPARNTRSGHERAGRDGTSDAPAWPMLPPAQSAPAGGGHGAGGAARPVTTGSAVATGPAERSSAGRLDLQDTLRRRAILVEQQRRHAATTLQSHDELPAMEHRSVSGLPLWDSRTGHDRP